MDESEQPHFIVALHSTEPVIEEMALALLMTEDWATPPAGGPDPSAISPTFITGTQSAGTTQYLFLDLEPGYYILLCFVPDPLMGGVPHSVAGMIEVVPAGV